jgi:SAM-dependent methyltransferase
MFGRRPDPLDPRLARERRLNAVGFDADRLETEHASACNLCGSAFFTRIAHEDRYGLAVTTALCNDCGLVFLDPRPSAAAYTEFYRRWYRPLTQAWSNTAHEPDARSAGQHAYAAALDHALLGAHLAPHHRRLLDLGGSSGEVALHFRDHHDLEVICVDPSPTEIEEARAYGLDAMCATAEDFDPGGQRFDVILICQAVDHLLDPAGVLRRAHEWLTEDGLLFIDPLDFTAMCARVNYLQGTLKIDHPYYFTRTTMDLYLARAGFVPIFLDAATGFHLRYLCRKATQANIRPAADAGARAYQAIRRLQFEGARPPVRKLGPLRRLGRLVRGMPR